MGTRNGKRWYLITYDICDQRRLQRVHRCLQRQALAMQHSVFLLQCHRRQLAELQEELRGLAHRHEDDIRIYPVQPPATLWMTGRQCERLEGLYPGGGTGGTGGGWLQQMKQLFTGKRQ